MSCCGHMHARTITVRPLADCTQLTRSPAITVASIVSRHGRTPLDGAYSLHRWSVERGTVPSSTDQCGRHAAADGAPNAQTRPCLNLKRSPRATAPDDKAPMVCSATAEHSLQPGLLSMSCAGVGDLYRRSLPIKSHNKSDDKRIDNEQMTLGKHLPTYGRDTSGYRRCHLAKIFAV